MKRQGRNWKEPDQLEFCDLCGIRVAAQHRTEGGVEGFYGTWLCPSCAKWGQTPALADFGGIGNNRPFKEPDAPHSGVNWIQDDLDTHS